jgi:hypothetical protein
MVIGPYNRLVPASCAYLDVEVQLDSVCPAAAGSLVIRSKPIGWKIFNSGRRSLAPEKFGANEIDPDTFPIAPSRKSPHLAMPGDPVIAPCPQTTSASLLHPERG